MASLSRRYPVPANNRKRVGVAAATPAGERLVQPADMIASGPGIGPRWSADG